MSKAIPEITVVIPTYRPETERFSATLESLRMQTLSALDWELVIVDNASPVPVDQNWCSDIAGREVLVAREPKQGLTNARVAGIQQARTELIIFCDDDNVLAEDYLEQAVQSMADYPGVGAAGGRNYPKFAAPPPQWYYDGIAPLGCRDLGTDRLICTSTQFNETPHYPAFSPIGAGMVFRRVAMEHWANTAVESGITDRKGDSLSSAGDCDMVLSALQSGFDVAYFPELSLDHLIPIDRMTEEYLSAVSRAAFRDFIAVLDKHDIRPWSPIPKWSVPLRMIKAWYQSKGWKTPQRRIQWQSACGQYEGRAALKAKR